MTKVISVMLQEGFCNRMSQYAFARAYAEKYDCVLQTNPWMGQVVFEINDPPIERDLPVVGMEELEVWDGRTDVKLCGWGQHQKNLIYSRDDVRRWFTFRPEILALLKSVPKFEVAAHLRWGDFCTSGGFIAITKESYLRACDQYGIDRNKLRFICEDDPIVVPEIPADNNHHTRAEDTRPTSLAFLPDFYALMQADIMFRGPSTFGLWPAILGHHSRVFSPDLRGIPHEGENRPKQDVPFVEGNHMPITCHWSGHSELHLRESSLVSHSQAGQDDFVYQLLVKPEGLKRGTFLDIGCGHPIDINNTYALEQLGWRGLMVDQNASAAKYASEHRKSTAVHGDATTYSYPASFKSVDYLSLDVDEAQVAALRNLLNQGVRFRVATVEHASYLYGTGPRDELRALLNAAGYLNICHDVCNDRVVYEDWWIDPKRVPLHVAARFISVGLDGQEIARRGSNKFCGFNGQVYRQVAAAHILAAMNAELIVETGTCNGETTGYLSQTSGLPVHTFEIDKNWFTVASDRLKGMFIYLGNADSREALRTHRAVHGGPRRTFFYLDAHWGEELPLAEEIDIIATNWPDFVILIDDFKVPDDPGYGFDDYGGAKIIGPELIAPVVAKHDLALFYPAVRSGAETGAKRGTAVLCRRGAMEQKLNAIPYLRPS